MSYNCLHLFKNINNYGILNADIVRTNTLQVYNSLLDNFDMLTSSTCSLT